jgi:IS1 family transposase
MFGVSRQPLASWLKKNRANPAIEETLLLAQESAALELDEMWSFVLRKTNKYWLWIAICRRTRQIVAFVLGDRSEASCRMLWERIPASYKTCRTLECVPQGVAAQQCRQRDWTGCHIERWSNTCRHELVTRLFMVQYNFNLRSSLVD